MKLTQFHLQRSLTNKEWTWGKNLNPQLHPGNIIYYMNIPIRSKIYFEETLLDESHIRSRAKGYTCFRINTISKFALNYKLHLGQRKHLLDEGKISKTRVHPSSDVGIDLQGRKIDPLLHQRLWFPSHLPINTWIFLAREHTGNRSTEPASVHETDLFIGRWTGQTHILLVSHCTHVTLWSGPRNDKKEKEKDDKLTNPEICMKNTNRSEPWRYFRKWVRRESEELGPAYTQEQSLETVHS